MHSTSEIYKANKKRRGRSKYLLSVEVNVCDKDGNSTEAKLVFVRDRNNRKKWVSLLSTDKSLSEEEIIKLYGKRWDVEVFFKMCKSYLALAKEFRQLSYDATTAHTTIVMLRYMMLSYEKRKAKDVRSLCEHFYMFFDEVDDLKYEVALCMILQVLSSVINNPRIGLSEQQIQMIMETFLLDLPEHMRICLAGGAQNVT